MERYALLALLVAMSLMPAPGNRLFIAAASRPAPGRRLAPLAGVCLGRMLQFVLCAPLAAEMIHASGDMPGGLSVLACGYLLLTAMELLRPSPDAGDPAPPTFAGALSAQCTSLVSWALALIVPLLFMPGHLQTSAQAVFAVSCALLTLIGSSLLRRAGRWQLLAWALHPRWLPPLLAVLLAFSALWKLTRIFAH